MTKQACTCGYQAEDPEDLTAHFGETFIPDDDTAPDGQVHFEASSDEGKDATTLTCRCGFVAPRGEFDQHLLDIFTPADRIGLDGQRHARGAAGVGSRPSAKGATGLRCVMSWLVVAIAWVPGPYAGAWEAGQLLGGPCAASLFRGKAVR